MKEAILIIGLPGSGKTTYAKTLGGILVDDVSQNTDELLSALASDEDLVVLTDASGVASRREAIESRMNQWSSRRIKIICYTNDPDTCWMNLCRRGDNKVTRSALMSMSKNYNIESFAPDEIKDVYQQKG